MIQTFAKKSIAYKAYIDIVTSSSRDRNGTTVVIQINFAELKFEINANTKSEKSNGDIVYSFMTQVLNWNHDMKN